MRVKKRQPADFHPPHPTAARKALSPLTHRFRGISQRCLTEDACMLCAMSAPVLRMSVKTDAVRDLLRNQRERPTAKRYPRPTPHLK